MFLNVVNAFTTKMLFIVEHCYRGFLFSANAYAFITMGAFYSYEMGFLFNTHTFYYYWCFFLIKNC